MSVFRNLAGTTCDTLTVGKSKYVLARLVDTLYVGTTPIALNRGTQAQTLTGVSIDGTAAKATNMVGDGSGTNVGLMFYQSANDVTSPLTPNKTAAAKYLSMTGDGTNGAAPTWVSVAPAGSSAVVAKTANFTIDATLNGKTISNLGATQDIVGTFDTIANLGNLFEVKIINQVVNTATGGTISYNGEYTVHTFLNTGNTTFTLNQNTAVEYLVVGGGGGGGSTIGGGGGGGGLRTNVVGATSGGGGAAEAAMVCAAGAYTVTVGIAGVGATDRNGASATNGGNSIFNGITSLGGAKGASWSSGAVYSGGSGGGAVNFVGTGAGTANQGYAGGTGVASQRGTGAGGAGSAGGAASQDGGYGVVSPISGSALYYSGGGAGGGSLGALGAGTMLGGSGVGGNGGLEAVGAAGTTNRGGGGGGGGYKASPSTDYNGGAGGTGIVIIRYKTYNKITLTPNAANRLPNTSAVNVSLDVPYQFNAVGIRTTEHTTDFAATEWQNIINIDAANKRVGIGTTRPSHAFHIAGTSASMCLDRTTNTVGYYAVLMWKTNNAIKYMMGLDSDASVGDDKLCIFDSAISNTVPTMTFTGGSVGIGTMIPANYNASANNLVVAEGTGNVGITIASPSASWGCLYFADGTTTTQTYEGFIQYNHATNFLQVGVNHRLTMSIDGPNGWVGINEAAPERSLEVGGDIQAAGMVRAQGWGEGGTYGTGHAVEIGISGGVGYVLSYDRSGIYQNLRLYGGTGAADNTYMSINATGVAVDAAAATTGYKFDVTGSIRTTGSVTFATADKGIYFYGGGESIIGTADYGIALRTSSTQRLFIGNNGAITMSALNVGTESYAMTVSAAGLVYRAASSSRYKENIQTLLEDSSRLLQLKPREFAFKAQPGSRHIGFIAEEAAAVFPSVVHYAKRCDVMGKHTKKNKAGNVVKDAHGSAIEEPDDPSEELIPENINWNAITTLLVEENKRQQHRIDELAARLDKFENKKI